MANYSKGKKESERQAKLHQKAKVKHKRRSAQCKRMLQSSVIHSVNVNTEQYLKAVVCLR
jgi:uncharacterized protein YaiL (DUF2058 family)